MWTHSRTLDPFYETPGDGGGGGGSPAGDTGSGGIQPQGGEPAAPAPLSISDDSLVQFKGMDKPVKYGEYAKNYLPRDQVGQLVREIIAASSRPQAQQQPRQQQHQQQADPFAEIENMPLVDGKTVAQIARQMLTQGFGPRDKALKAALEEIKALKGHVTGQRTGSLQNDYAISRDQVIKALPLPKTEKPIEGFKDAMDEYVDSTFWMYDFEKRFADPNARPHVMQEFTDTVKKRFDRDRVFFRNLEKAELEAAQAKANKARFLRPTGPAGPNGAQRPIRETNRQRAARFFAGREPAT